MSTKVTHFIELPGLMPTGAQLTKKINAAIQSASQAGGGHVIVPPGRHSVGTIFLKSNVTLEVPAGAELIASENLAQYPKLPMNEAQPPHLRKGNCATERRHLVVAEGAENVTLCGEGIIDGNVAAFTPNWEARKPFTWTGPSKRIFVPALSFLNCRNLRLRDITLRNSPGWTCHFAMCDEVRVEGVQLRNYLFAGNSDGFDVNGCRDVWFRNCHIETGDDCIVLKSFPKTRSCERIFISNCLLKTMCAGVKIGTETWHDFRQIHFSNSIVTGSGRAFQITVLDGGTVEEVFVRGLLIDTNCGNRFNRPIHLDLGQRRKNLGAHGVVEQPPVGRIRSITIADCDIRTDGRLILTAGDGARLEDITLRNIRLDYPWIDDPATLGDADLLQGSHNCPQARAANAAVVAENIDRLRLENVRIRWPSEPPGPDFLPKRRNGEVTRDPRKDFHPMPEFKPFWGKGLRGEELPESLKG